MHRVILCIGRHIVSGRGKLHVRSWRTTERSSCVGHTPTLCARYVTGRQGIRSFCLNVSPDISPWLPVLKLKLAKDVNLGLRLGLKLLKSK